MSEPASDIIGKCEARKFPVNGQGTFFYTCRTNIKFAILVTPNKKKDGMKTPQEYIALRAEKHQVIFVLKFKDMAEETTLEVKRNEKVGVQNGHTVTYWFSYDRDGLILKYGKGYAMEEATLMEHDFLKHCRTEKEKEKERKRLRVFFNATNKKYIWVDSEKSKTDFTPLIDVEPTFQFEPNPFVCDYPAVVKDSSDVTLFDLDQDKMMFSSSLPAACQELYGNIKGLTLEFPPDPVIKLSDAIRYSINTRGCVLYEKIKEKEGEFGHDKRLTYLRITLGPDQRTAPGIPYVLEIWPKGHMSPIHNHGGACAIVKVLFGRITVNVYNKQTNPPEHDPKPIKVFDAKEGDITWIGSRWFQTHRLRNRTDDFCATVQCYRYEEQDNIHWPDFDYVQPTDEGEATLEQFFPNSDFPFVRWRSIILDEYRKYLGGNNVTCD